MGFLIPVALFGFLPFALWLFHRFPSRRAVCLAFVSAILFLPNFAYALPGLPDYNKTLAGCLGVLLGMLMTDRQRLAELRLHGLDLMMLFWCLTPVLASLSNGLGLYDGISALKNYVVQWAFPYLIGRLYFTQLTHFEELAKWVLVGGLVYGPLCAAEIVLSPQLHNWVYGFHPHEFQQSLRGSTYRPVVFMKHGLMVGMWMLAATWMGLLAWRLGRLPLRWPLLSIPATWPIICLILVFIASKSMGALFFCVLLIACFAVMAKWRTKAPFYALLLVPLVYVPLRLSGWEIIDPLVQHAETFFGNERGESLRFRLENEELLVERGLEQPLFGWGGWGRSRVLNYDGEDITVADSLWIIVFGTTGIAGLIGLYGILALPFLSFLRRMPLRWWRYRQGQAAVGLSVLLPIYLWDNLLNDMPNPLFLLIAGGLVNLGAQGQLAWENLQARAQPTREQSFSVAPPYEPTFLS